MNVSLMQYEEQRQITIPLKTSHLCKKAHQHRLQNNTKMKISYEQKLYFH